MKATFEKKLGMLVLWAGLSFAVVLTACKTDDIPSVVEMPAGAVRTSLVDARSGGVRASPVPSENGGPSHTNG
ncbi:MAG: hypothetical protein HY868_06485 [Chloroflexi bacterium]|nr:hypothetical protein [Chloroflexota bacterium]